MTNSPLNFWKKLKKPVFVLAPMADVTDCAFRHLIAKYSEAPDARPTERPYGRVFWTEFVSADGLAHPEAREKLLIDLKYGEDEHPIVAQIFGGKPENIKKAAALCKDLGADVSGLAEAESLAIPEATVLAEIDRLVACIRALATVYGGGPASL